MAVFRVERTKDYTVMSNYHLRDTNLSLKAKGLLSQMLSLPEGWDYTLAGLAAINRESKDAIRSAVNELEQAGYINRRQTVDPAGKFSGNEYVIHEEPVSAEPLSENPTTDNPSTEKPSSENPTQLNIDISSKDISRKENKKEKPPAKGKPQKEPYDPSPVFAQFALSHVGDNDAGRAVYAGLVNFAEHRKAIKKPIPSQASVTALLNKLLKHSEGYPSVMVDMLDTAVSSGWQTVYPPKTRAPTSGNNRHGGREWEQL